MLRDAIRSRLPIIAAYTRDTLNFPAVVEELTKIVPQAIILGESAPNIKKGGTYYYSCPKPSPGVAVKLADLTPLYQNLSIAEAVLIVLNPPVVQDCMFNSGEVPVPKKLISDVMMHITDDAEKAQQLALTLGGLTIKESAEISKLTMVRDQSFTPDGLMRSRKEYFQGQAGLTLVESRQDFYDPHTVLEEWLKPEKQFFLNAWDHRLRPRGLLFDGPPGVGKTCGAKYLAHQWGVPLYRADIGTTKNMYVGESERQMQELFNRVDNEEPCVVLFDEVEKVFAVRDNDTSGTTMTMLSQMLWWLAEHRSRVMTVMTTNAADKLPKELYREGRIDRTMVFEGLLKEQAFSFATCVAGTFDKARVPDPAGIAMAVVKALWADSVGKVRKTQAAVTTAVYSHLKATTAT